jgi:hypothetical protein
MNLKNQRTFLIILAVLILVLTVGLIFSLLSANSKVASLNYVIYYTGEEQKKEKAELTSTITALETAIAASENKYDDLKIKHQDVLDRLSLASELETSMSSRLMCPSTIPSVDYKDDGTVSAALKEYTSDYKATDDYYEAVLENARITFHKLKSSRTLSFFMVYFADKNNGRVNGIFDVLGQCWVNLDNQ